MSTTNFFPFEIPYLNPYWTIVCIFLIGTRETFQGNQFHSKSAKDIIAVLEREPQMSKSTFSDRLCERLNAKAASCRVNTSSGGRSKRLCTLGVYSGWTTKSLWYVPVMMVEMMIRSLTILETPVSLWRDIGKVAMNSGRFDLPIWSEGHGYIFLQKCYIFRLFRSR